MKLSPMKSEESIIDLVWRVLKCFSTITLILITCVGTALLLGKLSELIYHLFGVIV
jgi:hypothetical protein